MISQSKQPSEPQKWLLRRAVCLLRAEGVEKDINARERTVHELFGQEKFLEADKALCELLQGCGIGALASQRARWLRNRASCQLRLERAEDAERACRLALRIQPGNADALEMLGAAMLLRQEGGPAKVAERFYQVNCSRHPQKTAHVPWCHLDGH